MKNDGFTLAEVIVSISISAVLIVALSNIFAKKTRMNNPFALNSGQFACYKEGNSNGSVTLKQASYIRGVFKVETVSECSIDFPENTKSFAISVVGAGGGGAAGSEPVRSLDGKIACNSSITLPISGTTTITNPCSDVPNSVVESNALQNVKYELKGAGGAGSGQYIIGENTFRSSGGKGGSCTWTGNLKINDQIAIATGYGGRYTDDSEAAGSSSCTSGTAYPDGCCTRSGDSKYVPVYPNGCRFWTSKMVNASGAISTFSVKRNGGNIVQANVYGGTGATWNGEPQQTTSAGANGGANFSAGSGSCSSGTGNNGGGSFTSGNSATINVLSNRTIKVEYRKNTLTGKNAKGGEAGQIAKLSTRAMNNDRIIIKASAIGDPGKGATTKNRAGSNGGNTCYPSAENCSVKALGGKGGQYTDEISTTLASVTGFMNFNGNNGNGSIKGEGAICPSTSGTSNNTCTNFDGKHALLENKIAKDSAFITQSYGGGGGSGVGYYNYKNVYNTSKIQNQCKENCSENKLSADVKGGGKGGNGAGGAIIIIW